jgi:hypothetical protein
VGAWKRQAATVTGVSSGRPARPGPRDERSPALRRVAAERYVDGVRSRLSLLLVVALPVFGLAACADVRERVEDVTTSARDRVEDATSGAQDVADRTRFCLDVARAASAIEGGSPETAADAAQEILAQAPEELRSDATWLAERLRGSEQELAEALRDPQVQVTIDRLREQTRELCTPTTG